MTPTHIGHGPGTLPGPVLATRSRPSVRRGSQAETEGLFLYAIVPADSQWRHTALGIGGRSYLVCEGELAGVVSDVPSGPIRPERRHLAAHHQVLRTLQEETTVLPVAFGTISSGTQALRRVLRRHRDALLEQMARVAGKLEMGVKLFWDVENLFEYFTQVHPELGQLRDRVFGRPGGATRDAKIELGRRFAGQLEHDREQHTRRVTEALAPHCSDIKSNPLGSEEMVMDLACLVAKEQRNEFEQAVFALARMFDDHYGLRLAGPWPPHHFVKLELSN
jgi:hypothetical protein